MVFSFSDLLVASEPSPYLLSEQSHLPVAILKFTDVKKNWMKNKSLIFTKVTQSVRFWSIKFWMSYLLSVGVYIQIHFQWNDSWFLFVVGRRKNCWFLKVSHDFEEARSLYHRIRPSSSKNCSKYHPLHVTKTRPKDFRASLKKAVTEISRLRKESYLPKRVFQGRPKVVLFAGKGFKKTNMKKHSQAEENEIFVPKSKKQMQTLKFHVKNFQNGNIRFFSDTNSYHQCHWKIRFSKLNLNNFSSSFQVNFLVSVSWVNF